VHATDLGHQICIVGAYDMSATTDRVTSGFTYFSRLQRSKCNKYASYPTWHISSHADTEPVVVNQMQHRHRPVCHTWLATEQCIIALHFLALGLIPGPKFTTIRDDLLPTQVYHPAKFHLPASTYTGDINYKTCCRERNKETNSKQYIPSLPIGMWG